MTERITGLRQIELIRVSYRKALPQFGVLLFEGVPQLLTLELPENNNKRRESCIPEGNYVCERIESAKVSGATYLVKDVPGRSEILFHHGNTVKDTEGCILTGSEFSFIDGQYGVTESKKAFLKFMQLCGSAPRFELFIKHA